ncbi:TetR family transcriptional regulator [Bacillus sp. WMMC1349]|uniref:TetR/AcrR family transcriptional regulator n=1 Tax=Bacillus sp. WMMC1349 TaxID=2736254 RepID=UPI00155241B7|nr:TetR/AcrR family transcriptional regulator [Bacillus sp. WMMC1349]NPC94127.1 TetR family transcriptional regulator [Bacillus sp. WMMC1349]
MKQKEKVIIEKAIKLFAKKGYNATSVQEIAKECQISKGAFYIYFKSKEALLLSVLHYYYDKVFSRIHKIQTEHDNPRTVYRKQLIVFFKNIFDHKEFIMMQYREQPLPYNEEIEAFAKKMRTTTLKLHKENIQNIYGANIEPYSAELCFLIDGMSEVYLELMVLLHHSFDLHLLADHILNCIDDLAMGMMKRSESPVISNEMADKWFGPFSRLDPLKDKLIQDMQIKIEKWFNSDPPSELLESLNILIEELKKQTPKKAIIKGMLLILHEFEGLRKEVDQLTEYIQKDILNS